MLKPSKLPEWATGGSATVTEPTLAKKQNGWKMPEKPSDGVTNWLGNTTYQWLNWLDSQTDGDYLIGRRLIEGANVTLTPVGTAGSKTERIDVNPDLGFVMGKSEAAETVALKAFNAEHVCKATVDNTNVSAGRVRVYADSVLKATVTAGNKEYHMFDADTDVEIRAENIFNNINEVTYSGLSAVTALYFGIFMRPTEDKFFVVGATSNYTISTYTCTPGNISTASIVPAETFDMGAPVTGSGIFFKHDGTLMYVCRDNQIRQYTLGTAWNPSTAGSLVIYTGAFTSAQGLFISPDGLNCFIVDGSTTNRVYHLAFGTAWNVSTLSAVSSSSAINTQTAGQAYDIMLNSDGTKMYILGNSTETIYQYSLSTAYTLGTPTYDSVSLNVSTQDTSMRGMCMVNDLRFYTVGDQNDRAYQYPIGAAWAGTARYQLEYGESV